MTEPLILLSNKSLKNEDPERKKLNVAGIKKEGKEKKGEKNLDHFSIYACHPCAGAMLIFSVSFQFYRMSPKGQMPM